MFSINYMDTTLLKIKVHVVKKPNFISQVQPIAPATGSTTISTSGGNNVGGVGKVPGRSRAMLRSGGGDSAVPLIMDDSSATTASQVTNQCQAVFHLHILHVTILCYWQMFNTSIITLGDHHQGPAAGEYLFWVGLWAAPPRPEVNRAPDKPL